MVTFLGGTVDMNDIADDMITLKPTREKEDAMATDIKVFLANMRMSSAEASSLRGRVLSWASYIAGRLAFGCLGALDHQADTAHSDEDFSWELEQCLNMILAIIELRMYRTLPLITSRPITRVYTDASFCIVDDIPIVKLCGIICDKYNGIYRGFVTTVPPSALLCFTDRATQIIVAEALAVILMLGFEAEMLRHRAVILFIDNMSAMYAFITGKSRAADISSLAFALQYRMISINLHPWFEYVPSVSNIADGGSRIGIGCQMAHSLGISLVDKEFPELPHSIAEASFEDWRKFWRSMG